MAGNLNVKDRGDLLASLKHWQRELAAQQKVAAPRSDAVRRRIQIVQARIERRESQLRRLEPHPGRRLMLSTALSFVGVKEQPPDSNSGPHISEWEHRFHISGQPWCGAFVGAMAELAGRDVTDRIVFTPYIYEDALAARDGLGGVVWHDQFVHAALAHTASLVLFDFGTAGGIKHVAILAKPWFGRGPLETVEGNTSFGPGGSQDNGGCVARRSRPIELVHSIVALAWP